MAVADVELDEEVKGMKSQFCAHSEINDKEKDKDDKMPDFSPLKDKDERTFNDAYIIVNYERYQDTEAKILEDIAARLGDRRDFKGKISLYTELEPCPSCLSVMRAFRRRYPQIGLEVFYTNKYSV